MGIINLNQYEVNNMLLKLFLSICLIFFYAGCTKTPSVVSSKTQQSTTTESYTDDNEFEDEFSDTSQNNNTQSDPLRSYNEVMTSFNDVFITYGLNPISKTYGYIIPQPLRIGVSNAFKNIQFPVRFVNNILQGKVKNATQEWGRFVFNSTLGLGGLIDISTNQLHIPEHKEDFGQTLGYYGVGSGFHVVLPFLGPSNLRDIAGLSVDAYASPLVNVRSLKRYKIPNNFVESTAIVAGYLINKKSLEEGQYESLKKDALELYPFLRDIYEQKRNADIAK